MPPKTPRPRPAMNRWLVAEGSELGKGGVPRQYILHTKAPKFVAEVLDDRDEPPEAVGVNLGGGQAMVLLEWWDPAPTGPALDALLREAAAALAKYDADLEAMDEDF